MTVVLESQLGYLMMRVSETRLNALSEKASSAELSNTFRRRLRYFLHQRARITGSCYQGFRVDERVAMSLTIFFLCSDNEHLQ